jgi:PST family polysaccharide transporter
VNVVLGLFWLGLTELVAPLVAAFFANPAGEDLLRALAWTFPLKYLGNAHDALCQKSLRFRARTAPEVGMAVVKAGVSIALAASGFGVWSLVWGQLLGQAAWTLLLWVVVPWRPRRPWPKDLLRPMLAYGRGVVAVNVLAAITHHADLVVVGHALGAVPLGLYQMAAKIPETSVVLLLWVTSRVLFPAFARVQAQGGSLAAGFLAASRFVSLVTLPVSAGLAVLAEPVVVVAFGESWRASVPILRALAIYAAFRSLSAPVGDVLKAMGRPGLLAALGFLRALVLVPALVLASRSGAAAVALALAVVTGAATVLTVAVGCRLVRVSGEALVRALRPSAIATLALVVVLLACARAVPPQTPAAAVLLLGALFGSMVYLAAVRVASPETWRDLLRAGGAA